MLYFALFQSCIIKRPIKEIAHDYGYEPKEINGSDKYDVSIWEWTEEGYFLKAYRMVKDKSNKFEILERIINLYHAIHLYEKARKFEDEYAELTEPQKPIQAKETMSRNAPCPCGSGKKYKKCCMNKTSI